MGAHHLPLSKIPVSLHGSLSLCGRPLRSQLLFLIAGEPVSSSLDPPLWFTLLPPAKPPMGWGTRWLSLLEQCLKIRPNKLFLYFSLASEWLYCPVTKLWNSPLWPHCLRPRPYSGFYVSAPLPRLDLTVGQACDAVTRTPNLFASEEAQLLSCWDPAPWLLAFLGKCRKPRGVSIIILQLRESNTLFIEMWRMNFEMVSSPLNT